MLRVQKLSKRFAETLAVDDLSFEVARGRIFGLLGPNGAGKTTTISMISGLLIPDSGEVQVGGHSIARDPRAAKALLGVVPQELALYQDLNARENLDFWGGLYGMRGRELRARVDELLELIGLRDRAAEPVKQYSGGMKRRLNLAMGLIHRPQLLLLDEPTVGIDPQARKHILDTVQALVAQGTTILYTTHYLDEAEHLCDELAIMDHGRLLARGSIEELKAQLGEGRLVSVSGDFSAAQVHELLRSAENFHALEVADGAALLLLGRERPIGAALEQLVNSGVSVQDFSVKEPNLEDLFLKLTGRELRD